MNNRKVTKTYDECISSKSFITAFQGSSRSGKTYNILKALITFAYKNRKSQNIVITICRQTVKELKGTVIRDFLEIIKEEGYFDDKHWNKTEMVYTLFGVTFEFINLDDEQKIRGRKRHVCFINEANKVSEYAFIQLKIRTSLKMIIDFNPSNRFWVDKYDCDTFHSTYKDNPFLSDIIVKSIEDLKDTNENLWKIYGLGEYASFIGKVFNNYKKESYKAKTIAYGLDFGFSNHVTALVEVSVDYDSDRRIKKVYAKELIYEKGLLNSDLANRFKSLGVSKHLKIYCDDAEPKSIQELKSYGYSSVPAKKGIIIDGINLMLTVEFVLEGDNLVNEFDNYRWKESDSEGTLQNQIIDKDNHLIDALRYALINLNKNKGKGFLGIIEKYLNI